jgi:hypothetical protein
VGNIKSADIKTLLNHWINKGYEERYNNMKQPITTTLKAKVLTKTAEELSACSEAAGLSIGEMLDRIVLNVSPKDPALASSLILDSILRYCSRLDNEQFNEAIAYVAELLLKAYQKDNPGGNRARLEELVQAYKEKD